MSRNDKRNTQQSASSLDQQEEHQQAESDLPQHIAKDNPQAGSDLFERIVEDKQEIAPDLLEHTVEDEQQKAAAALYQAESSKQGQQKQEHDSEPFLSSPVADTHQRYSRQELFAPLGRQGQQQLLQSTVLIIGAGALGSSSAETLVRAGVGRVIIADRDYVEWSNLQRQQLFTEQDAANRVPKAIAARDRLRQINSTVQIEAHIADVTADEIEEWVDGVDLIMDATDNFETRLLINDISQKHRIPWIYGGCVGSYGITFTIVPGITPCLQCLMESAPLGGDTCDTSGIIPPAVQMVVAHQTTEALKLLSGHSEQLRGTLLSFDLWRNEQVSIKMNGARRANCPSCGEHPTYPHLSHEGQSKSEVLCGRDTVQIRPAQRQKLDLQQTARRLKGQSEHEVTVNPFLLSMTLHEGRRMVVFQDGRVMVHGTKDIAEARTVYHRYFG